MTASYRTPVLCAVTICGRATLDTTGRCADHRSPAAIHTLRREVAGRLDVFPLPAPGETHRSTRRGRQNGEDWRNRFGYRSRGDGPAVTYFHHDSTEVAREEWWVHGIRTRFGSPALIEYALDGSVTLEVWWFDDHEFGPASYFECLAAMPDDELDEAFRGAGWSELLDDGGDARVLLSTLAAGIRRPEDVYEVVVGGAPLEWMRAYIEAGNR